MKLNKLYTTIKISFQEKNHKTLKTIDIFCSESKCKKYFFSIGHYSYFL